MLIARRQHRDECISWNSHFESFAPGVSDAAYRIHGCTGCGGCRQVLPFPRGPFHPPINLLLVDPHMPVWLPEITIRNLHVGAAVVDIRFYRTKSGASDYEVLDKRGPLHIVHQPSPWPLTATFGERLQDALSNLLPGK